MYSTKYPESKHKIFRAFVIKDENGNRQILRPGDIIKCTKITAMAINTMQPLTIRKLQKAEAEEC